MKKYLPYLNILGAAACWGCIGLFNRFLMRAGMGAANIVVIRNFGGLVLLTLIFALRERSVFHVKAKHLPIFFGTGVVSMVFFTLCYFKCQELCSLAVSAILLYTAPAMVVLMSAAVFRERITRKKLLALALALLGCSFVTGVWSGDASVTAAGGGARRGRRAFSPSLTMICMPSPQTRMGISVGKRHGKSVQRNRIKRLLREAFRAELKEMKGTWTIVLVPKVRDEYELSTFKKHLKCMIKKEKL